MWKLNQIFLKHLNHDAGNFHLFTFFQNYLLIMRRDPFFHNYSPLRPASLAPVCVSIIRIDTNCSNEPLQHGRGTLCASCMLHCVCSHSVLADLSFSFLPWSRVSACFDNCRVPESESRVCPPSPPTADWQQHNNTPPLLMLRCWVLWLR